MNDAGGEGRTGRGSRDRPGARSAGFRYLTEFQRIGLWLGRVDLQVEGAEHVPDIPGVIVASNHLSLTDPMLVTVIVQRLVGRRVRYMTRAEALDWPGPAPIIKAYGGMGVQGGADRQGDRMARAVLDDGDWLGLAPEGRRSRTGSLAEPKQGVALLALRSGAPILPVGIWGSERLWPVGARLPRPGARVTVRFGPVFRPGGAVASASPIARRRAVTDAATEDLMSRIAELLPPGYRGRFQPPGQPLGQAEGEPPAEPAAVSEPEAELPAEAASEREAELSAVEAAAAIETFASTSTEPPTREQLHGYWIEPDAANAPDNYLDKPQRTDFLLELLGAYADRAMRVLEIGCNVGRNLEGLRRAGYSMLEGVEISHAALEQLRDAFPTLAEQAVLHETAVEDWIRDAPERGYDLVFTMATLEHVHPDSEWIFSEMARICGRLLVTIEDEQQKSWRHFPRNYGAVFEGLGLEQLEERSAERAFNRNFRARVFTHR